MKNQDETIVNSFREITASWRLWVRARHHLNRGSESVKSLFAKGDDSAGWIRFLFYHHVFNDEQKGFSRQLQYLKGYGEFLSLDDAVELLNSGQINGKFFCVTFDDGVDSCYDFAFPILAEMGISGAFFVMPDFMTDAKGKENRKCLPMPGLKLAVRYFSWEECREMADGGMIIGSHTCSHARLSEIANDRAAEQLKLSKEIIEKKLGRSCNHFACPWGRPGVDFQPGVHEILARDAGYLSFLTVQKGVMRRGDSPYLIKRNYVQAEMGNFQLRYRLEL